MTKLSRLQQGKYKELRVISELLELGLDVYPAAVDDQGIDCVVRVPHGDQVAYYDVQIKGYRGYNRVVGVYRKALEQQSPNYLLVLAFFHETKPDEVFFLTRDQVLQLKDRAFGKGSNGGWGDLLFNKPERQEFAGQTIERLPEFLRQRREELTQASA